MGYQYVENLKNARELVLREYEDMTDAILPDERFSIKLKYYDNAQLIEERKAYDVQVKSFEIEVQHMWDVLFMIYQDSKFLRGAVDFDDLAKIKKNQIRNKIKLKTGDPVYEDIDKVWDEINFVRPGDTDVERMNRTYIFEKNTIKKKFIIMRDRLKQMYEYKYPKKRRIMEERLTYLESEFQKFDYLINPYHIQPGLLLDVDITSIKKKKATLDGMANVLNEFLHGVSKGFQDAAFASFSRRRSTVREDIAQSFMSASSKEEEMPAYAGKAEKKTDYIEMLGSKESSAPAKITPRRKTETRRGVVDVGKRKGTPTKTRRSGLTEI
jgi:hypothetical protein